MSQWRKYCLVFCLLLLGACSGTTFVYNRLDFVLPWYVDDYAELNSQQDVYLDELLAPFLTWHRNQELPAYIEIIDGIEGRLDQPLTGAEIADVFAEFEAGLRQFYSATVRTTNPKTRGCCWLAPATAGCFLLVGSML